MNKKDNIDGWRHGHRENVWNCGGKLEYTGKKNIYGLFEVLEQRCTKCGELLDSTDAYYSMLSEEEYQRRKELGWEGYD